MNSFLSELSKLKCSAYQIHENKLWLTLRCAKSSKRVRSDNSTNKEYTRIHPYMLKTMKIVHNRHIMILYANIISLTIEKKRNANNLNIVNTPKVYSHGTIFFSYS